MPAASQVHAGIRATRYRICYSESQISDLTQVPLVLCHRDRISLVSDSKSHTFQPLNTASELQCIKDQVNHLKSLVGATRV